MVVQTPVPPAPPTPPMPPTPDIGHVVISGLPWFPFPPEFLVPIAITAIIVVGLVLWPLFRALARRIEGNTAPNARVQAELEQLRERVGTLETQQVHLAELEERLDFAERLLTQQRAHSPSISAGGE